jgi:hypothetical protein
VKETTSDFHMAGVPPLLPLPSDVIGTVFSFDPTYHDQLKVVHNEYFLVTRMLNTIVDSLFLCDEWGQATKRAARQHKKADLLLLARFCWVRMPRKKKSPSEKLLSRSAREFFPQPDTLRKKKTTRKKKARGGGRRRQEVGKTPRRVLMDAVFATTGGQWSSSPTQSLLSTG